VGGLFPFVVRAVERRLQVGSTLMSSAMSMNDMQHIPAGVQGTNNGLMDVVGAPPAKDQGLGRSWNHACEFSCNYVYNRCWPLTDICNVDRGSWYASYNLYTICES
jgi:hypothetical protein